MNQLTEVKRTSKHSMYPKMGMFASKTVEFFIMDCGKRNYYKSVPAIEQIEKGLEPGWINIYPMYGSRLPMGDWISHYCKAKKTGLGYYESYFNQTIKVELPFKDIQVVATY